jgi:hypothetical protein
MTLHRRPLRRNSAVDPSSGMNRYGLNKGKRGPPPGAATEGDRRPVAGWFRCRPILLKETDDPRRQAPVGMRWWCAISVVQPRSPFRGADQSPMG